MIHPSYSELIDAINTNNEEDAQNQVLNSRYSLVLATSKRARQLIAGAKPLVENAQGKKPLAIAIDELYKGKVKILPEKAGEEELAIEETDREAPEVITEAWTDAAGEDADAVSESTYGEDSDAALESTAGEDAVSEPESMAQGDAAGANSAAEEASEAEPEG